MTLEQQALGLMSLRLAGLILLIGCLVLYDTGDGSVTHRLLLPLVMALAAWAMVQNLAAVAIGVTVLATIHTDLASGHWIDGHAYPLIALVGALILAVTVARRFANRVRNTHPARWLDRRSS